MGGSTSVHGVEVTVRPLMTPTRGPIEELQA